LASIEQLAAILLATSNGDTVRTIAKDVGLSKSQVWRYQQTVPEMILTGDRVVITRKDAS
jgi:hypothetical protein